ncbi:MULTISPECIES: protein DpdE [unclassified Streptomyces]|uniref:protein DpdE n=1 Tax=unclassified Streptomyces TaxID=2593676 RepID=UPI002DDB707D|nr:protein DpdE [Streptomyces sp. NBC_01788]WSB24506.1 protein DpdE [Streptomyces sp. NBC_01788]
MTYGHADGSRIGTFVRVPGGPGIGKIGAVEDGRVRVDYFESPVTTVAHSQWVADRLAHRVLLDVEERIWWRSRNRNGAWNAGRVAYASEREYIVRFPNADYDLPVSVDDLYVRWDRPVQDPVASLAVRGGSTAPFRKARLPMLHSLVRQRGACAGMSAFVSSSVEIYPHQIDAALTVLSDPIQRYLLADEVGLGKTIEAGYVIRQVLLDDPTARVVVVAPAALRRQWLSELQEKFHIGDFSKEQLVVTSHETPHKWQTYEGFALVVVDEAHALVQSGPQQSPYRELCALAHSAQRLLLLSATPVTSHYLTNLGLLHLLDPKLYRWDQQAQFEKRYVMRAALADSVQSLDPELNYVIRDSLADIADLLPASDTRFHQLASDVLTLLDDEDELIDEGLRSDFAYRVAQVRAHLSETYRIHRRVIRHRREAVLRESTEPEAMGLTYMVRGRARPTLMPAPSGTADAGPDLVLRWWNQVRDHLDNQQATGESATYGMVLAVLAARATGLPQDVVDVLRWRVDADEAAAQRAGVSAQERALLAAAPVVAAERGLLDSVQGEISAPSREDMRALVDALLPHLRGLKKSVIFCGPGQMAGYLTDHLRRRFGRLTVAEHSRLQGPAGAADALTAWSNAAGQAVLIADDSAEDGLNLQVADGVFHLRLPWSANQLEQRLGRVDRYPGAQGAGGDEPAAQFRLADENGSDASFSEAWAALLTEGYEVFDASTSTLQDAIARSLQGVWEQAFATGPEGLLAQREEVRRLLREEQQEIAKMDLLESIHTAGQGLRSVPQSLIDVETDWKQIQSALEGYTDKDSGGIRLQHVTRSVNGVPAIQFNVGSAHPLLAPRHWRRVQQRITDDVLAAGVFNRSVALRHAGTRLFRLGNPLVDLLSEAVLNDDLGQSAAFRRIDRRMPRGEEPQPYYGFDFLIEADVAAALSCVEDSSDAARALRRQADRILAPFVRRMWVEGGTNRAVTDPAQVAWLNAPYDKLNGDRNYNSARADEYFALFGGQEAAGTFAREASQAALGFLHQHTNLTATCEEAQQQALEVAAVLNAQCGARRAAGHLVTDTEGLVTDAAILQALAKGLSRPVIRIVAAVCVVRRGLEYVQA